MYIRRDDVWLGGFILVLTGLTIGGSWLNEVPFTDPVMWQVLLEDLGVAKHVGFLAVQTLQVVVPFLPGQATGIASGYLFGTVLGLTYEMVGSMIGSVIAFVVARRWGRDALFVVFDEETVRHWDGRVDRYGVQVFFAMLLLPGFPDDALCFMAGLSDMRFDWYLVCVFFGRLPLFALYAYAGSNPGELWSVPGMSIAVGLTVVSAACFWYRESLFSWLTGMVSSG